MREAGEEDFATWLVSWREGDTVTATPATGAASTLVADVASAGSRELPRAGGLWTLESAFWTVTLQFEDGTERTAKIAIVSPGLIISIK